MWQGELEKEFAPFTRNYEAALVYFRTCMDYKVFYTGRAASMADFRRLNGSQRFCHLAIPHYFMGKPAAANIALVEEPGSSRGRRMTL